jgi:hypothetical protein
MSQLVIDSRKTALGTMATGLDAGKYFWRSGREKCFSLDIPFNRTSGQNRLDSRRSQNVVIYCRGVIDVSPLSRPTYCPSNHNSRAV